MQAAKKVASNHDDADVRNIGQGEVHYAKYSVIQKDGLCLYTDSLFAQTGDSNDECSSSLEVEC